MNLNFFKNSKSAIGLDISDLSLKLVQLTRARGSVKIQALNRVGLEKGIIDNGEIKNEKELANGINKLISNPKYGSISAKDVVACLPETKTFVKLITVEKTVNDLSITIESEIEKYVPFSKDEIYYDWQMIEQDSENYTVLIGAAQKSVVDQFLNLINLTKLNLVALEIEPVAICRCLLNEESSGYKGPYNNNYGIIDIGAKRSSMLIYSKNTIVTSASIPISSEAVTEKISEVLKIKRDQAEKAKIICGLDENKAQGIIKDILTEMISKLNNKIKDVIEFYYANYPERGQINKLILCGGGSNINNLADIISQTFSIETVGGDSFANINESASNKNFTETHKLDFKISKEKTSKPLIAKQNTSLSYTTAIGLALRSLNTKNK